MSRENKLKEYLERVPASCQGIYKKAYGGSKANAVKAKCLDCTCNQRDEVRNCTAVTCPLWIVRPYQGNVSVDDE